MMRQVYVPKLCTYNYVKHGEIFEDMEHEKPILDTKHNKMVLLLIEMAKFYGEMDNPSGWKCVENGLDLLLS